MNENDRNDLVALLRNGTAMSRLNETEVFDTISFIEAKGYVLTKSEAVEVAPVVTDGAALEGDHA